MSNNGLFRKFNHYEPDTDSPGIIDPDSNYGYGYAFDKEMGCPKCNAVMEMHEPIDKTQQLEYSCKKCGIKVNPKVKQLKRSKKAPLSVLGENAFQAAHAKGVMSIGDGATIERILTPSNTPDNTNPRQEIPTLDPRSRTDLFARTVNKDLSKYESDVVITGP